MNERKPQKLPPAVGGVKTLEPKTIILLKKKIKKCLKCLGGKPNVQTCEFQEDRSTINIGHKKKDDYVNISPLVPSGTI